MAGTLESSDVMVRIAPAEGPEHDLLIASSVEKQFGDAIRHTLLQVFAAVRRAAGAGDCRR
ncbi:Citrate lyase gamma chain [Serratia fonticola]|uniref:Citrate lyase gamma chain n=1 Tax=Serratia fonticola TaxID=47917 RepID=A0A4U9U086_SERFO|nr:Citrate lyase gamma chain [Serratia fonticola]